jgi:hypothetical protein
MNLVLYCTAGRHGGAECSRIHSSTAGGYSTAGYSKSIQHGIAGGYTGVLQEDTAGYSRRIQRTTAEDTKWKNRSTAERMLYSVI